MTCLSHWAKLGYHIEKKTQQQQQQQQQQPPFIIEQYTGPDPPNASSKNAAKRRSSLNKTWTRFTSVEEEWLPISMSSKWSFPVWDFSGARQHEKPAAVHGEIRHFQCGTIIGISWIHRTWWLCLIFGGIWSRKMMIAVSRDNLRRSAIFKQSPVNTGDYDINSQFISLVWDSMGFNPGAVFCPILINHCKQYS